MARKKLITDTPVPTNTRADTLVSALLKNKGDRDICCAKDLTRSWRYIDFIDPKKNRPCLALEYLFGGRGLLAGRIIKLQAKYGVGKSSLMWLLYACGQIKHDAWCYHMETEAAPPPPDFIASFGCDPARLVTGQPKSLEQAFELIDEIIATIRGGFGGGINEETGRPQKTKFDDPLDPDMQAPIMIGFDSISAIDMEAKTDQDIMDMSKTSAVAAHARKVSEWFRNRTERLRRCQALLMMTAQSKANIKTGPSFGGGADDESSTIADTPIGFHATYVVKMTGLPYIDKERGLNIGERVALHTHKNKISPKHRRATLYLVRDHGFDLVKTDAEFLISDPASPIAARRHSHGITCEAIQEKSFKNDDEFLAGFYANTDLVQSCREKLRIRGWGFDFETNYSPTDLEVEDNKDAIESDT